MISAVDIVLLVRNPAGTSWKGIFSMLGAAVCLLTMIANVWFILYVTHIRNHMLDAIEPGQLATPAPVFNGKVLKSTIRNHR